MLLTGILEIGVLEVLLIGVLLPSGPDNLAIGVPPVGEKAYFALAGLGPRPIFVLIEPEIQKKGDWKRPPTPYVKGLTSGEALRVIIALANNYMEKFYIPGF